MSCLASRAGWTGSSSGWWMEGGWVDESVMHSGVYVDERMGWDGWSGMDGELDSGEDCTAIHGMAEPDGDRRGR